MAVFILIFQLGILVWYGGICQKMIYGEMMKRFEYKVIDSKDVETAGLFKGRKREDVETYLNALGAEGWELVNVDFRELEGGLEFAGVMKKEA